LKIFFSSWKKWIFVEKFSLIKLMSKMNQFFTVPLLTQKYLSLEKEDNYFIVKPKEQSEKECLWKAFGNGDGFFYHLGKWRRTFLVTIFNNPVSKPFVFWHPLQMKVKFRINLDRSDVLIRSNALLDLNPSPKTSRWGIWNCHSQISSISIRSSSETAYLLEKGKSTAENEKWYLELVLSWFWMKFLGFFVENEDVRNENVRKSSKFSLIDIFLIRL